MDERIVEYQIKKIIKNLLIHSNNDILLADNIMSYIKNTCKICFKLNIVLQTKYVSVAQSGYIYKQKQDICKTCYKSNKNHFITWYNAM